MNKKRKLNCYVFSNLIVSMLSLNYFVNSKPATLSSVEGKINTLNKIYEIEVKEPEVVVPNPVVSSTITPVTISSVKVSNNTYKAQNISYVKPSYNSVTGSNIVSYAKNYLGLRYDSHGYSLSSGTDCSGFTKLIYGEFGISLGRTVSSQASSGSYVSKNDLAPGDLVFYSYGSNPTHVAIYIGNGLIIHESNPRDGVKISSVNIMNYITARRVVTSNVTSPKVVNNTNTANNTEIKKEEVVKKETVIKEEVKSVSKEEKKVTSEKTETKTVETKKVETKDIQKDVSSDSTLKDTKEIEKTEVKVEKETKTEEIVEKKDIEVIKDTEIKKDNSDKKEIDDKTDSTKEEEKSVEKK